MCFGKGGLPRHHDGYSMISTYNMVETSILLASFLSFFFLYEQILHNSIESIWITKVGYIYLTQTWKSKTKLVEMIIFQSYLKKWLVYRQYIITIFIILIILLLIFNRCIINIWIIEIWFHYSNQFFKLKVHS